MPIPAADMVKFLQRMQLPSEQIPGKGLLRVRVPVTRSDVLHACDILEDVAIAFGYNNVPRTVPVTGTVGKQVMPIFALTAIMYQGQLR